MQIFTRKQNQSQARVFFRPTQSNLTTPGLHHPLHPTLHEEATPTNLASPRFSYEFSQIPIQPQAPKSIQTKLKVNPAGDEYEQEADRIADVMRSPSSEEQRARHEPQASPAAISGSLAGILPGGGESLPESERAYFEPRFGHDFSRVRVHTDARAAQSAEALGARAYTLGQDIVFGQQQYAPGTSPGRRLLAHELAHVVQQSGGGPGPVIQRQLKVTGSKSDIKAMLSLLGKASGLTLTHDSKSKLVSAAASGAKAQSPELAKKLQSIINDTKQDAELNLRHKERAKKAGEFGTAFGEFPESAENLVQEIRIDQILALEKGVPGAGTATLIHEIVENYEAHALTDYNWSVAYATAHKEAEKVEDLVAGELIGPGSSRNTFPVETGKGKKRKVQWIDDRAQYFIVWDASGKSGVSNARKVGRVKVSTYTIDGFSSKSSEVPESAAKTIAALAADMKDNPTASALIESFASAGKTADKNERLAIDWAELVQDKVIEEVGNKSNTHWRRFHQVPKSHKSLNRVVVTLERPDL